MSDSEKRLVNLLRIVASGDATVERAKELESLIAIEFPHDPRLEDLEVALATFSPLSGAGLIGAEGLAKASKATLVELGYAVT